ncbi:hypothetical protein CZ771_09110 [Actinomycetales bacterium JB111]|nr:hypothetical protein CZ771_09110 [Actinomycetales bacterium JB111]
MFAVLALVQGILVAGATRGNDVPAEFETAGDSVPGIGEAVEVDGLAYTVTAVRTATMRLDEDALGGAGERVVVLDVEIENVASTSRPYRVDGWLLVDEATRRHSPVDVSVLARSWQGEPLLPHAGSVNPGVVRTGVVVFEGVLTHSPDHLRIAEAARGSSPVPELGAVRLRD